MKRGHQPHSVGSESKHKKLEEAAADDTNSVFPLFNLPEDEFKHLLKYLPIRDRANLKVTSKDAEKKLMLLDPTLKRWTIYFSKDDVDYDDIMEDYDSEIGSLLTQARKKHIKDGDLQDIEIYLGFIYRKDVNVFPEVFMKYSEMLIKEWKDNIVSLRINITGKELYFLDPKFVLPQLSCLSLTEGICPEDDGYRSIDYESEDTVSDAGSEYLPRDRPESHEEIQRRVEKTSQVVSCMIENHKDTLETLHLDKIFISSPSGLQLKQFEAINVDPQTVYSVLNGSYSSLRQLDLRSIYTPYEHEFNGPSTLPQLKELNVSDVIPADIGPIIKSSSQTLEKLVIKKPRVVTDRSYIDYEMEDVGFIPIPCKRKNLTRASYGLDSIELKIKTFEGFSIQPNDLEQILKASQKFLEELDVNNRYINDKERDETSLQIQGIKLLKLNKFSAQEMTPKEIGLVLDASCASLKVLDIRGIRHEELRRRQTENNFHLNCFEFHIRQLSAYGITQQMVATILAVPNDSLVDLSLSTGYNSEIVEEEFEFQCCHSFPIRKFVAGNGIFSSVISKIIKSSKSTLEDLSIYNPLNCSRLKLDDVKLKLKSFVADKVPTRFVESVLKASQSTLQELKLEHLVNSVSDDFQFYTTIDLGQLNKFTAFDTHSRFVESVLKASQSTLQELKLEQLVNSVNDDFQFDSTIDLGQLNKFTAYATHSKFVEYILKASKSTLQELEVRYLVNKYNGSDDFQFKSTINLDQLNRFSAYTTHSKFVESVLKASQSTLQELKLEQLVNSVNDDFQFDSKIDLAQLNKFTACNAKSKFVISVIRSAKTSLKYLYLESINLYEMPGAQLIGMMNCRICNSCWTAYRRYAATTPGGVSKDLANYKTSGYKGKKATTLILQQTLLSQIAKKLPKGASLNVRQLGRKPNRVISMEKIKDDCCKMVSYIQPDKLKQMLCRRKFKPKCTMEKIIENCGRSDKSRPAWLIPMAKDQLPKPAKEAFPRPLPTKTAPSGSLPLVPAGPSLNRIKVAAAARGSIRNGIEVKAAPDDIFFKANKGFKSQRSEMTSKVIKKLARRPMKSFR